MNATKIYKHQNEDGTFTYTNEEGIVIINKSKKDHEFFTVAYNGKGLAFGKFTTRSKELENYRAHAAQNLDWMNKHLIYWANKYGWDNAQEEMKKAQAWVEEANEAKVQRIETK